MRPDTEGHTDVVDQGPDIGPFGTGNSKGNILILFLKQIKRMNRDRPFGSLNYFSLSRALVESLSVDLDGRIHRWYLPLWTREATKFGA
jgi:hypothetical protein